ncbi:unnamed protein product [Owenia fusiformis]|uniref:Chitin-binding type-2 domain-containing protein n=1 Tax=Owenia fusiformis TaxID=6347 RepID=A0A8S4NW43_OWEFU|nr:unnamed protein product [Owenia fusiformis]
MRQLTLVYIMASGTSLMFWIILLGTIYTALAQEDIVAERLEVDPEDCLALDGILPDETRPGGDCCHFIQCDASDSNKTGFRFACMYPLVWHLAIGACDEDTNVEGPCIHTTCSFAPPPKDVCESDAEIKATYGIDSCCIEGEDGVYEALQDISPAAYRFRYLNGEYPEDEEDYLSCPKGQIFSANDCCCESDAPILPECESDIYFSLPEDDCCTYHQCYINRTGYFTGECLGTVWNQKILNCDDPQFVEGCEDADCLINGGPTAPPCPVDLDIDQQCCLAGIVYTKDFSGVLNGASFFIGEVDLDNIETVKATQNVGVCDEGQDFQLECCCCLGSKDEFVAECDCIEFTFENDLSHKDALQGTAIQLGDAVVVPYTGICGEAALEFAGTESAVVNFFARKSLGNDFTFSFGASGSGVVITNGDSNTSPTFSVDLSGGTEVAITLESGAQVTLNGGSGTFVTIVKADDSLKLYIDGNLADEQEAKGKVLATDCPLKIGEGYTGQFDELVYCTFAYNDAQVSGLTSCQVDQDIQK